MFGGQQKHRLLNHLHILNMTNWVNVKCVLHIISCNLSLSSQHWSGVFPTIPADLWPRPRSLHSACALVNPNIFATAKDSLKSIPLSQCGKSHTDTNCGQLQPKLFVLWGRGATDAWVLDVNSTTWKPVNYTGIRTIAVFFWSLFLHYTAPFVYALQVKIHPVLGQPRHSFCLGCLNRSPTEAELVVFGGLQQDISSNADIPGTTLFYLGIPQTVHVHSEPIIFVCTDDFVTTPM